MAGTFENLGQVVRFYRKQKKLTLQEVADAVTDYDAGNLSRFERGTQGIAETKLREIAAALNMTIGQFYSTLESGAAKSITYSPKDTELFAVSEASAAVTERNAPVGSAREFFAKYEADLQEMPIKELMKVVGRIEAIVEKHLKAADKNN